MTLRNEITRQQYDRIFFEDQFAASSRSAAKLVPLVLGILKIQTVVDVGCGIGCWAAQFLAQGANVLRVAGDWVDRAMTPDPKHTLCLP